MPLESTRTVPTVHDPATETIRRARDGDHDAFADAARERASSLYRTAIRVLGDRGAAEDAVQDTLLAAWRGIRGIRDVERFDAWLYRLLIRSCRNEARRRRRTARTWFDRAPEIAAPGDAAAGLAERDAIGRAFRTLSIDHRVILVLRFYEDHSVPEIAELLGVPVGTAKSRLHFALRALRSELATGAGTQR